MAETVPSWAQESEVPDWAKSEAAPTATVGPPEDIAYGAGPQSTGLLDRAKDWLGNAFSGAHLANDQEYRNNLATPEQQGQLGQAAKGVEWYLTSPEAAQGTRQAIQEAIPSSPKAVGEMFFPPSGAAHDVSGTVRSINDVSQGASPDEAFAKEFPDVDYRKRALAGEFGGVEQAKAITGLSIETGMAAMPFLHSRIGPKSSAEVRPEAPPVQAEAAKPPIQPEQQPFSPATADIEQRLMAAREEGQTEVLNKWLSDMAGEARAKEQPTIDIPKAEKPFKPESVPDTFGSDETPVSSTLMNDIGGVKSKSAARKQGKLAGNPALWDDAPALAHPTHGKIYNPSGEMPDVAAQALYDSGLIRDPSPSAMWQAVQAESQSSRRMIKQRRSQSVQWQEQSAQEEARNLEEVNKELAGKPQQGTVTNFDEFKPPDEPVQPPGMAGGEAQETGATAGTSNRQHVETYGENQIPGGKGADTVQLLDDARAGLAAGKVDPYEVLSRTRTHGIATSPEYATLAAEHERLVNQAVRLDKAGDPGAVEAAKQAEDFANAIQPHKTAASDLMRLFQGDLNYDLGSPFGMEQYMKAELGRAPKAAERPAMQRQSSKIRQAQSEAARAVDRSDVKVQRHYGKVADITMEEAATRVKEWLKDCT